ncbi:MAG: MFS transporter [Streptosporangiaceae bacterium]|jgi:MFS family permease
MRRLFAHRDARLYLIGQVLSVTGDGALWLAMAIWVKILTHSNSAAGFTIFAFISGLLTAPLSGLLADRVRRRPLLIWANVGSAALVCLLLIAQHRGEVWLIYAVLFGYGVLNGLIMVAQTAFLVVLVPDDLLPEANTVLQTAEQGLRLITPLIGAGLLAWVGPDPVILVDVGTFLLAALALLALRVREEVPERSQESWNSEFMAGIRHIGRTPALRRLLIAGVVALVAFGFFQIVPFAVVAQGLHRSPPFLGVLETATGVGAVVGGVLATSIIDRTSERALVLWGVASCVVAAILLLTTLLPLILIGMALAGACDLWVNIGGYIIIQRNTPVNLLGRVDAALSMAIVIPQAISLATGASLIGIINYRILLVAVVAILVISFFIFARGNDEAVVTDAHLETQES